jgi:hypothetical protein
MYLRPHPIEKGLFHTRKTRVPEIISVLGTTSWLTTGVSSLPTSWWSGHWRITVTYSWKGENGEGHLRLGKVLT